MACGRDLVDCSFHGLVQGFSLLLQGGRRGLGGLQHVPQTLNIGFEELLFGSVDGGIQVRRLGDGVMAGDGGGNRLAIENINLEERHVGQGAAPGRGPRPSNGP